MRITLLEACQVALALSGLLILSACGSAATTPTPATPTAAGTPSPGAANPTPATGVATLAGTAVAAPAATPGVAPPTGTVAGTPSATRRVTLDDSGQTLQLQAGQRFLLALGTGFDWTVTVGDPPCRKAQPPCGAPSRLFRVEIVVR